MPGNDNEKTFFGFWPADDHHCSLESLTLDISGNADEATQRELKDTLLNYETDNWHIIVSKDYMCLLHLKLLEEPLNREREHNRTCEMYELSLGRTRQIKNQYIEALNALYFLIFSSCFTGRGNYFLHDFAEVTVWQCLRVMYSSDNMPLRRIQFGRGTKKEMSRMGLCIEERSSEFMKIELNIFKDAIHYWDIVYTQDLISLAAVGTKIISEHRLESYNLSVVLAWFEIENWIMKYARVLEVETHKSNGYKHGIERIINNFPLGTTVANLASELHVVRDIRNDIAHNGSNPIHEESKKAIELFMKMFNIRSGLNLSVDLHPAPSSGM